MNATPGFASMSPAVQASGRSPHAVVIGSGFGGLAAAVRLSVRGYRVTVLEKLDAPGGRAYVHRRDGFVFDAGPTIVTAPFLFEELWALCGRRFADDVELRLMDPFYRIRFEDGTWFDYSGDAGAMRAEVARFSPADLEGYERFLAEAEKCYRLGFEELGAVAFDTLGDLFAAIPSMVRMRAWRSIHTMAARHLRDPKLRIVMSFHPLLIGGNPFSVTCVYSLITSLERRWGVHWAMGGTGALVRGLTGLLDGLGATVRCNAEVKRIDVERGRATGVTLAGGEHIPADIVVSNADTAWTYRHLIEARHRRHWSDRKIERGRYSMSLFVWYFGTRRQYPDVPHHMILLGPRYRELLQDIFRRHVLADDFSLYLHRPTATDPSMAPAGCDTFYVLAPVPHLGSGTNWAERAEPYRQAIADALDRTVLPGFQEEVVTSFVTTPQDFQDRLLSFRGAAFGLEPLLLQSAWFRPHNRSEDIEGLYLVGASTHPGAGIPGVLTSAKALDSVVPEVAAFT
ncbi:MAG: phytoene desaturase [Betaproteobacteria bacterium]|jgi:phytoene desaturase